MRGPSEQVGNVTEEVVPTAAVTGAAAPVEPDPAAHLNLTDHVAEDMNAELSQGALSRRLDHSRCKV